MNTKVTCYDLTGNSYYGRQASGFCGSQRGQYTISKEEITCEDCLTAITQP